MPQTRGSLNRLNVPTGTIKRGRPPSSSKVLQEKERLDVPPVPRASEVTSNTADLVKKTLEFLEANSVDDITQPLQNGWRLYIEQLYMKESKVMIEHLQKVLHERPFPLFSQRAAEMQYILTEMHLEQHDYEKILRLSIDFEEATDNNIDEDLRKIKEHMKSCYLNPVRTQTASPTDLLVKTSLSVMKETNTLPNPTANKYQDTAQSLPCPSECTHSSWMAPRHMGFNQQEVKRQMRTFPADDKEMRSYRDTGHQGPPRYQQASSQGLSSALCDVNMRGCGNPRKGGQCCHRAGFEDKEDKEN